MTYNLTKSQKEFARWLVESIRNGSLPEEFVVVWTVDEGIIPDYNGKHPVVTKGILDALSAANYIISIPKIKTTTTQSSGSHPRTTHREEETNRRITVVENLYTAVDSNFSAPDTSFVTHLTPLADITNLDSEIKARCLPTLGAGSDNPRLWDSAIRTAGVILENRLRDIGGIGNKSIIGVDLVNKVFAKEGTLASKFQDEADRQSYRDLFAGIVGIVRNPFAHRLIDPTPEDGGAILVFINLLLKMLENLRQQVGTE